MLTCGRHTLHTMTKLPSTTIPIHMHRYMPTHTSTHMSIHISTHVPMHKSTLQVEHVMDEPRMMLLHGLITAAEAEELVRFL